MKIHLDIDESYEDIEITIKCPQINEKVLAIESLFQRKQTTFPMFKETTEYYIDLHDVLFFETDAKEVVAHTAGDIYHTDYRLYELETILPGMFLRISKSAIVNVEKIFALTRNMSTCLIEFQNTFKHVYASRQYYKPLKEKLEEMRKYYE
ncbi:LytTR family DNA-binding domain-containing protein [uncultured Dubosiella sp.]|uniref:LytTR family DNA-binding domain-containing protein n=1 Tax=uncultured Dubosiella sp. TaxID=1937011 RepID=UPI00259B916D|nr:LytTR family DNA-binding domain-containing protein [uncultured Dubosiella sp.]